MQLAAGAITAGACLGILIPPSVFGGMMPFMGIQVLAIFLLYPFPAIGMWLPNLLYK